MRPFFALLTGIVMLAAGAVLQCPALQAQEKSASVNDWEFKAVHVGPAEKEATKRLNDLASEGWQYVGPLGDGLVAFRRHHVPREQLVIEVADPQPRRAAPGERVAINVTVRSGDRSLLPGAKVTVAAGGGNFLTKDGQPIDRKDRGSHPRSWAQRMTKGGSRHGGSSRQAPVPTCWQSKLPRRTISAAKRNTRSA